MCLAVPAQILTIQDDFLAQVEFGGIRRTISLQLLPQAQVGDYVLVHTGFAISIVDPEEARITLDLLRQMSDLDPDD
ncbi:MAG TPA: HypC/HybG/HupF family hydrogenase formation chaperone [Anaerolineae bacterium]|nr:HypC/HybG/HupF family hydrogenase formation chaperone [Caldilineae bacterium]HID34223.1 HypC/HybG/HupF family hydrogenase formation chaperone [Anaerolineae bacterium]